MSGSNIFEYRFHVVAKPSRVFLPVSPDFGDNRVNLKCLHVFEYPIAGTCVPTSRRGFYATRYVCSQGCRTINNLAGTGLVAGWSRAGSPQPKITFLPLSPICPIFSHQIRPTRCLVAFWHVESRCRPPRTGSIAVSDAGDLFFLRLPIVVQESDDVHGVLDDNV